MTVSLCMPRLLSLLLLALVLPGQAYLPAERPDPAELKDIKAYCIDFNWAPTQRRGRPFAKPGLWADKADPSAHVAWYKAMGANVIQTFAVSTNGYAWYKNGFVPEQPGLKHDFLTEVVKLGHEEGMLVFGYFCAASNPKWGEDHPDQSYGTPTTYHIPYTDEYLDYLSKSVSDAVKKTGMDGFMVDWIWMPNRKATEGKWLESEKKLYQQLMGQPFPGEEKLTKAQDTEYSRKALDRCWKAIHQAAKQADPDCLIWVTVNRMNHPHVMNSAIYKEADWLMNEAGSMAGIEKVRGMIGDHTKMITCMARWNGQDAVEAVPEALEAGVGLYGFTYPRTGDGLVPLDRIFTRQVSELSGDERNIAVLGRAYQGMSIHSLWKDGGFVEPETPPSFRVRFKGRGRGMQDTASVVHERGRSVVTVRTPYARGRGLLVRSGKGWPSSLAIRLQKRDKVASEATDFMMANGELGVGVLLGGSSTTKAGKLEGGLDLGREWRDKFLEGAEEKSAPMVEVKRTEEVLEVSIPPEMTAGNPEVLAFEWLKK